MTIVAAVIVLVVLGLLTILAIEATLRKPIKFKSFDERDAVCDVAIWAQKQIGPDDPRRRIFTILRISLAGTSGSLLLPLVRMTAKDLEVLAPFIDQSIAGKGPPSILPAEYEDWRPAALSTFKVRMRSEGFWPKTPVSDDVAKP